MIEEIARNCRLLPQNLANCIDDFHPIRESAQWLGILHGRLSKITNDTQLQAFIGMLASEPNLVAPLGEIVTRDHLRTVAMAATSKPELFPIYRAMLDLGRSTLLDICAVIREPAIVNFARHATRNAQSQSAAAHAARDPQAVNALMKVFAGGGCAGDCYSGSPVPDRGERLASNP